MALTRYRDVEWFQPGENPDPDDTDLQKAWLHRGSFFAHAIRLAPGYVIPPHSHDRDELMVVLAGSATLDSGVVVEPPDTLLLAANVRSTGSPRDPRAWSSWWSVPVKQA